MNLPRKRKTKDPCLGCGLHRSLCICDLIPQLDLKTRVCLVIHYKELKRTTNSGRLAVKSLINGKMFVRGEMGKVPLDLSEILSLNYRSLLFYPSEDAQELNKDFISQSSLPIQLIVPDGNWRQASKICSRHPELKNIPKVKITAPNTFTQHLRKEHMPEGMATLQAIACALNLIEGPAAAIPLFQLYEAKLRNTLKGRGLTH